jgi:serine/threonine protein kinase
VTLTGVLGRGASSSVYLGTQEHLGRIVAVKVLRAGRGDPEGARLFAAEAQTLGRLASHPNILTVFDVGLTESGRAYLVSEYLPGGSFADLVRRDGPLLWREAVAVGVQLAGALETTRRHGVVHGDVKPQNVLVGRLGQPVLADYGVARHIDPTDSAASAAITPLHAAPELLDGRPPTPATDVYGLASTIFQLIDGESPTGTEAETPLAVIRRLATGEHRRLAPELAPEPLADLIERCISPDADDRLPTAAELGEALRAIEDSTGSTPTPMPVMDELPEQSAVSAADVDAPASSVTLPPSEVVVPPAGGSPRRRRRQVVGAIVGVVAVLAALAVWRAGTDDDERAGAEQPTGTSSTTAPSTSTTEVLPQSDVGGIQPGIVYDLPDLPDTTPELESALSDEELIFRWIGPGRAVEPSPLYGAALESLPAEIRYQAFNPLTDGVSCKGFMSRRLALTGLWERGGRWSDLYVQVAVAEFATREMAFEMFTALSAGIGATPDECKGISGFGIDDYDEYGLVHRDVPFEPTEGAGIRYNNWRSTDLDLFGVAYPEGLRSVARTGSQVIDVAIASDGRALLGGDAKTAAAIIEEIARRL